MKASADRFPENRNSSVSKIPSGQDTKPQGLQFKDSRPETATHNRLKSVITNSAQVRQLAALNAFISTSTTTPMAQHMVNSKEDTLQESLGTIQKKDNNTGLPDNLKSGIENLSGIDISDVKVHYNSEKPSQLQAHAYAQGTEIHVASGQEQHLPHEAWHVVQQKQGRVKPTLQLKDGVPVNDDVGLEHEADIMGDRALQLKNIQAQKVPMHSYEQVYQRRKINIEGFGEVETTNAQDVGEFLDEVKADPTLASKELLFEIKAELDKGTYEVKDDKYGYEDRIRRLLKKLGVDDEEEEQQFPELENETYWQMDPGLSKRNQLEFLRTVVMQARSIIPVAINRKQERPADGHYGDDWVNQKAVCMEELVKFFSGKMKGQGMKVDSNYIHPAALERIILLINEVADQLQPNDEVDKRMGGICKDFASIVFGLIIQNDPTNMFETKLGFIKDHVFVEVVVAGEWYVIDAWRTAGKKDDGVVKKQDHLDDLNHESRGNVGEFRELKADKKNPSEKETALKNPKKNESLIDQYANYKKVYALWKKSEGELRELAQSILSKKQALHVATGKY